MRYAYVKDNDVKMVGALPKSHANVSGFNKMSKTKLKDFNFLPLEYNAPQYDRARHKLGNLVYDIKKDKVIGTHELVELTSGEVGSRLDGLKKQAASLIVEYLYKTDWTELEELPGLMDGKFQSLRNLLKGALNDLDNLNYAQADDLIQKLNACHECLTARKAEFTENVDVLVTHLEG